MSDHIVRYPFIREERFFCTLIMMAAMKEPLILKEIFDIPIEAGETFEIYNEASVIRDYWYSLGEVIGSKKEKTNEAREKYLQTLCEILKIDFEKLRKFKCFKSSRKYVNSPANYLSRETGNDRELNNIRALFNMRQDLLIMFKDTLFFIEAKLESPNSSKQINNMVLLTKLIDKENEQWAGIDSFSGIKNVKLYYIKKTVTPLDVEDEIQKQLNVISWNKVFRVIKPVINNLYGVEIDEIQKRLKI